MFSLQATVSGGTLKNLIGRMVRCEKHRRTISLKGISSPLSELTCLGIREDGNLFRGKHRKRRGKMKNLLKAAVTIAAILVVFTPGEAEALIISRTAPTSLIQVCPAGQYYDSTTKACRQNLAQGTSQTQSAIEGDLVWRWDSYNQHWDLTLVITEQVAGSSTFTTYGYSLYSVAGTEGAPPPLPDPTALPDNPYVIQLEGFVVTPSAPLDFTTAYTNENTPLWNRLPVLTAPAPVPEPSTLFLLGAGLAGWAGMAYWRKTPAKPR